MSFAVSITALIILSYPVQRHKLPASQYLTSVSVGLLFLIPQLFYEQSIGLEIKFNKAFFLILFYVVVFPAIAAYYCWQKGVQIIGPNRSTMFVQLMPLFSAVMAIIIFNEKFELYHFAGAAFIVSGIYLSNKKTND